MKVSVIVPTYRTSQEGLNRLVASLDCQTMPQEDFEVLLVDDGSPDDTVDRLREVASTRQNYQVFACENSGWPSKPRNFGIARASGEYLAFIDHDDEFFPTALLSAHQFAVDNGSDVVNGKESYTHQPDWGLETYKQDLAQSRGRTDLHPLLPMNPHKLYRKAFLDEHSIRFEEGARVLWEDVFFNLQVSRHANVISTLASVPYYHWVMTEGGGSDTAFSKWTDDYWFWYRRVLEATVEATSGDDREIERAQLLERQYIDRVLGTFDSSFPERPAEARAFLIEQCSTLQKDFNLTRFDPNLSSARRAKAILLSRGAEDELTALCAEEKPIAGEGHARSVRWVDGRLEVRADVAWKNPDGGSFPLRREDGRIVKQYSPPLAQALPAEVCDFTDEVVSSTLQVSVRDRRSRMVWLQPSTGTVTPADGENGTVALTGSVTGTVDPTTAALGHPLESMSRFDIFVRARIGSNANHRGMHSDVPATITIHDGRLHLFYSNDGGKASLVTDGQVEAVRRLAPISWRLSEAGEMEITLAGTHDGEGTVATTVEIRKHRSTDFESYPAVLSVAGGTASLRFSAPDTRVSVRVGDRTGQRKALQLAVADGQVLSGKSARPSGEELFAAAAAEHTDIRILLLTNNDSDNVGDQLIEASAISILQGAMLNLGLPIDRLTIESRAAGIIPLKYLSTQQESLLRSAREAISAADVVVFGGAPLFNYRYQEFYARTIKTVELAQEYGVSVIFSSIGVEPYDADNSKSRALQKALQLPVVRQITTRDDLASTQKYVAGTGIPVAHVADPAVLCDIVFRKQLSDSSSAPRPSATLRDLIPYPVKRAIRRIQGRPAPQGRPAKGKVGLVVTRAGIFKDNGITFPRKAQADFWMGTIAKLQEGGYDYRLFTTGHFADEAFLDELVKAKRIPQSKVAPTVNSPEELIDLLSSCDGVIAYRLHASIAAFALGVPCIGLSWNFKVPFFYQSVGYGDRALSHERWTADEVVTALEKAMREGVDKDLDFLYTVYASLFNGLKSIFAPNGTQEPWTFAALRAQLPPYAGTDPDSYRDKVERKLRRVYESYRRYAYKS